MDLMTRAALHIDFLRLAVRAGRGKIRFRIGRWRSVVTRGKSDKIKFNLAIACIFDTSSKFNMCCQTANNADILSGRFFR